MSEYDTLRHLADTVGLVVMTIVFVGLCAWPFLPGKKHTNERMANSIFEGDDNGE
ncbi:Cbb3-type cytochrome oxidase component FixQ [Tsuneonella dongtanensis]|uniref:Cbb3-type cytochrome oxidase component FixQ n=1 Tax=Tsuneonella dongtanensis TaxID=692370 RepID=A0A1B2ABZ7_9SPHN|nr:CcoQ/FixQ family Cbb3-type cytochrome c oxidase assembly chaperone [Tsuneonella dongtanensis]ANY19631.1 Cbb3-type cytochrome oxidase component FixQ [Tsuneonella dongtanensis]